MPNEGVQFLDKVLLYAVYPVSFLGAIYMTLLGFGIVPAGVPDRGDEQAQAKRLKLLRLIGPFLIIGIAGYYILKLTGVF